MLIIYLQIILFVLGTNHIFTSEAYLESLEQNKIKKSKSSQSLSQITNQQNGSNVNNQNNNDQSELAFLKELSEKKGDQMQQVDKGSQDRIAKEQMNKERMKFLTGLSKKETYQQYEQQQEQEQKTQEQQEQLQEIKVLKDYYENSDYKEAISTLNDKKLQTTYNNDLDQMQLFFFEYTLKELGTYHVSQKKKKNQITSADLYLQSLISKDINVGSSDTQAKEKTVSAQQPISSGTKIDTVSILKQSDNTAKASDKDSTTAWLASLEGKK